MFLIETEMAAIQCDSWECEALPEDWDELGPIGKLIWLEDNATHCGYVVELADITDNEPDSPKVSVSRR